MLKKVLVMFFGTVFSMAVKAATVEIVVSYPPGGGIDFQAISLANELAKSDPNITVKRSYFNSCSLAIDHATTASKSHPTYLLADIGDMIFSDKTKGSRCPPLNSTSVPIIPMSKLGYAPVALCHSNKTTFEDLQKKSRITVGYSATAAFTILGKYIQNTQYIMVPYKATAEARRAYEVGDVDMIFIGTHTAMPMMKEGTKCVAVTSDSKISGLPSLAKFLNRDIPNWESMALIFRVGSLAMPNDPMFTAVRSKAFTDSLATRYLLNGGQDKDDLMSYILRQEKILFDGR